jgi:hypothetical protein
MNVTWGWGDATTCNAVVEYNALAYLHIFRRATLKSTDPQAFNILECFNHTVC